MSIPTAFLPMAAENADLARYRQIDTQLRSYALDARAADRGARLRARYDKYPWLSPGIATAYTKWEEQFGKPIARGLATAASRGEDLEKFVATKDFQSQVNAAYKKFLDAGDPEDYESRFNALPKRQRQLFAGTQKIPVDDHFKYDRLMDRRGSDNTNPIGDLAAQVTEIPGVKPAIRAGMTALETPYQEVQALGAATLAGSPGGPQFPFAQDIARDWANSLDVNVGPYKPGSSTGAIAVKDLAAGKNVDLGTGYLPGGQVTQQHTQAVQNIASLRYGGERHFATTGRFLAAHVVEPGTKPFNTLSGLIDASQIITTDPANYGLEYASDVAKARKGFAAPSEIERAGGFTSWARSFVDPPTVDQYLASKTGTALKESLAQTGPEQLAELGRRTNWKWDAQTYADAIRAQSPEEVDAALRTALGTTIDRQPALNSFAANIRNRTGQRALLTEIPGTRLQIDMASLGGPNGSLRALYNHALGLGLDDAEISRHLSDILTSAGTVERSEALVQYMNMEKAGLLKRGIAPEDASRLTRFAKQDLTGNARRYFDAQIGTGEFIPGVAVGGTMFPLDKPYLLTEHLGDTIYLNPLQGKGGRNEALWKQARVLGIPGTSLGENLGDFGQMLPGIQSKVSAGMRSVKAAAWESNAWLTHMQNSLWKPLALIRGAWAVRVLGEEQIRMAMAGYDNFFTHPISYIGFLANKAKGDYQQILDYAAEQKALRNLQAGAFGLVDSDRQAYGRILARATGTFGPAENSHAEVWANKLAQYSEDPLMSRVAKAIYDDTDIEDLKDEFIDGSLSHFREDLARDPHFAEAGIDLTTNEGAAAYIDGLYERLHYYTGGNGDLIGAVAHGRYKPDLETVARKASLKGQMVDYDGTPVEVVAHRKGSKTATILIDGNDEQIAVSMLSLRDGDGLKLLTKSTDGVNLDTDFANYLRSLPDEAKPAQISGVHNVREPRHADDFVNWAFGWLMDRPTSYLNRSTVVAEEHVAQMKRLQPFVDAGEITAEEADTIAKAKAVDKLRDLLYDTHKRNRGFAALQLIMPFGEAWKEMLGSWARVIAENPQTIRKGQVAVTAAMGHNPFSDIPGAVPDAYGDKGFFFKDPSANGAETFVYPWSSAINEQLLGVPIAFTGQAQNLSMGFNLVPGVGPAFQVPAMWFMNRYMDNKTWDPVRHLIAPYGSQAFHEGFLEQVFAPAWMKKFLDGALADPKGTSQNARVLNSAVMDVLAAGVNDGTYDMSSPVSMQRALKDAESKARVLYFIRGTFQFGAPAAPKPEFLAEKKNGKLIRFQVMRDAYYKLIEKDPSTASEKFIDRFGEGAMFVVEPKTLGTTYGVEFTQPFLDWRRDHKDIAADYPLTYAEFGPHKKDAKFSYEAYLRASDEGERQSLTAAEWTKRTNNVLGAIWYDKTRAEMGLKEGEAGTKVQQAFLADVRNQIHEDYPGWRQIPRDDTKNAQAIEELLRAAKDPRVKKSNPDLVKAISYYAGARSQALAQVKKEGGGGDFNRPGYATAAKWAPLRQWLRDVAGQIGNDYPQFRAVFEDTFSREMKDDEDGIVVGGTRGRSVVVQHPTGDVAQQLVQEGEAKKGPYVTTLSPQEEQQFEAWVQENSVPFDLNQRHADYDMRGFWKALQANDRRARTAINQSDGRLHFPDTWKTPYHKTFSNQSIYATKAAPRWKGSKLVDRNGKVIADESVKK